MKFRLLLVITLSICQFVYGVRPTVQSSNFKVRDTSCISATLTWTSGNGNARLIVGKEGNSSNFTPNDGQSYQPSSAFGSYMVDANGTSAVYNANGTNFVNITNLKEGTTYTFYIFEHDNGSANPLYLTTNAPSITFTTYKTTLNFNLFHIDSCRMTNVVRLTNLSSTTNPRQTFYFTDGIKNYNADKPIEIHINASGYYPLKINTTKYDGCSMTLTKEAKIFPKQLANFSHLKSSDTIKDYPKHVFNLSTKGNLAPFPIGVTYSWDFGDNTISYVAKPIKSYVKPGIYKISCELGITSYAKMTACKDTIYKHLIVKPYPYLDLKWDRDTIFKNTDHYVASVNSDSAIQLKWYFGDGDSSDNDTTNHIYTSTGVYTIRLHVKTNYGYEGDTTRKVVVIENTVDLKQTSKNKITIGPNPSSKVVTLSNINNSHLMVYIFNQNGQLIQQLTTKEPLTDISFENYPSGIYTFKIIENEQTVLEEKISISK